jgi:serine/threonine-protein kinase
MDFEGALLGQCLGNYRLVRMVGCGSMGEVYEGEHVLIGRRVAVKVLLQSLSRSEEAVSRFFTEARTAATMRHPGIVEVFDFGYHPNGSAYIIMELLEGETVAERVERLGRLPVAEAVSIARKLASAMACAHACGVIHRDLKPENLVLVADEDVSDGTRLKVLDFGIAKLATAQLFGSRSTRTGQIMGTPAFMSPEQCHGASDVDERSDIYSLGCIMYFMLTGQPPFDSDGVGEVIAQQLYETPVAPDKQVEGIPARINAIVMHLLEKNPDDRPGSMDDVAALLASWISREADDTVPLARPKTDSALVLDLPPADSKPVQVTIQPEPYYSLIDIDAVAAVAPESTAQVRRMPATRRQRQTFLRWWASGGIAAIGVMTFMSWGGLREGVTRLIGALPSVEAAQAAAAEVPAPLPPVRTEVALASIETNVVKVPPQGAPVAALLKVQPVARPVTPSNVATAPLAKAAARPPARPSTAGNKKATASKSTGAGMKKLRQSLALGASGAPATTTKTKAPLLKEGSR